MIMFAPGACRWDAAGLPIPGGNAESHGWSLERYHARIRELQGPDVKIVGTLQERDMVAVARKALGLR